MIQDIAPYRYRNEYKPVPPEGDSVLLCYDGRNALIGQKEKDGEISFPTFAEAEACMDRQALYKDSIYLFSISDQRFYLGSPACAALAGYRWEDTRIFRKAAPKYLSFAGVTGWQLDQWYKARRFCGRCGKPLVPGKTERMMYCPACGLMEYPKICPAVIIAVTHGSRLLMSRYANRDSRSKSYALLAGFAEIGETLEETVKREVMEEVGLSVKHITYYKSQPWSFTDTLLAGFYCELEGDCEEIRLDEQELSMAEWFEREEIPVEFDNCSLTNEMITRFKQGLQPDWDKSKN